MARLRRQNLRARLVSLRQSSADSDSLPLLSTHYCLLVCLIKAQRGIALQQQAVALQHTTVLCPELLHRRQLLTVLGDNDRALGEQLRLMPAEKMQHEVIFLRRLIRRVEKHD